MKGKRKADNGTIVVANCRDCEWDCQYEADAREQGKKHAQSHGHLVTVEISRAVTYDCRQKRKAARRAK